jgi:hypothetical protein
MPKSRTELSLAEYRWNQTVLKESCNCSPRNLFEVSPGRHLGSVISPPIVDYPTIFGRSVSWCHLGPIFCGFPGLAQVHQPRESLGGLNPEFMRGGYRSSEIPQRHLRTYRAVGAQDEMGRGVFKNVKCHFSDFFRAAGGQNAMSV